jgi:hypothetical protein
MVSSWTVKGRRTYHSTPPREIATKKLVKLAIKRKAPTKSTRRTFSFKVVLVLAVNLKKIGMATSPKAQKGRLIQNAHLHAVFSAITPPIIGPRIVPNAQAARTSEKYFGLWRRGMMSAKTIWADVLPTPHDQLCYRIINVKIYPEGFEVLA